MAYKNFTTLTSRNQSSLVTQLYKLINYYGGIFIPRERGYLKSLTQNSNCIYWLEDEERKMIAVSIVDPNYVLEISDIKLHTIGHTIAKRPGQMERILHHIWSDYEDDSLVLFCRKTLASVFDLEHLGLVPIDITKLEELWPELTAAKTDYFNIHDENLKSGIDRKQYGVYLKLSKTDLETLSKTHKELFGYISKYVYEEVE